VALLEQVQQGAGGARAAQPRAPGQSASGPAPETDAGSALARLLGAIHPTLVRCLRGRLPDAESDLMQDLVQEAALHVIEGVDSCRAATDEQLRSWACVVAIRAGLAFLRSPRSGHAETRWRLGPEAAACTRTWADWAADQDPADPSALQVLARLAADAHGELTPAAASVVWDRVIDDVSWAEAAGRLGTTPPGAKRRFQRAQRALERLLWDRAAALPEPPRAAVLARLTALAPSGAARRARGRGAARARAKQRGDHA
jgi:DNA-directed RNA polymerase specialized sigma24 family protein